MSESAQLKLATNVLHSESAQIKFATDILRRLGEELNPGSAQSILELVKNAYDADAHTCTIELKETNKPGGSIIITDDGGGMDAKSIKDSWLILGKSNKSSQQRTRLGRVPTGNKGLGRLAALRMGTAAALSTRPWTDKSKEYNLYIGWKQYENVKLTDQIDLEIEETLRKEGQADGTEVLLEDLHASIGRMDVKRLARALILLANPFEDDPEGFRPRLLAPEFSDLELLVKKRYFDDADYHLIAEVNDEGKASASVVDWKGELLFSVAHEELIKTGRKYRCPPAKFDLWVFLLGGDKFSTRKVTLTEVREWLKEFGGVHLYENGLRVMPYGNPGNDWLDMNVRRARGPEERPSTNTVIGRVSVTNTDELLTQKTDRSGFIETEGFLELRLFAQDALDWMAKRRLEVAEIRRAQTQVEAPQKTRKSKEHVQHAIENAPQNIKAPLKDAFNAYDKARDKEVDHLRKEIQLYRTLSTAGITAATFAHESSGNPIKVITQSIKAIKRRAQKALKSDYENILKGPVNSISTSLESLSVLGSATLKLLDHEKRKAGRVEIHTVIDNVLRTFTPFLVGRDVTVKTKLFPRNPYLRGSEAAVESIITNLLNNSLAAFERAAISNRTILIATDIMNTDFILRVSDNGPGIEEIEVNDIWLPGQTTKANGTGLGLTIVRDSVRDLGGKVRAVAHSELGGAEITIELPILGS